MLDLDFRGQVCNCGFWMIPLVSMSWRQGKYKHIGASKLPEETLTLRGLQDEDLKPGMREKVE